MLAQLCQALLGALAHHDLLPGMPFCLPYHLHAGPASPWPLTEQMLGEACSWIL